MTRLWIVSLALLGIACSPANARQPATEFNCHSSNPCEGQRIGKKFPSNASPSMYIKCTAGGCQIRTCDGFKTFNPVTNKCGTATTTSTTPTTTTTLPEVCNCFSSNPCDGNNVGTKCPSSVRPSRKFVQCKPEGCKLQLCPGGKLYNPALKRCTSD